MSKSLYTSMLWAFVFLLTSVTKTFAQEDKTLAETVVHLLSYVSMDYPEAVQDGEIIDQMEFEEQQEFTSEAYALTLESSFVTGNDKETILEEIQKLIDYVNDLRDEDEISALANSINDSIIKLTGIETAPKVWPSIANGKRLYAQTCATCHGDTGRGDGPGGIGLDPEPSDFHEEDLMDNFSAYQAYNSIRFGVTGTGMIAYTNYNENELWDLAFYVKSLRYQEEGLDSLQLRKEFNEIIDQINLKKVASLTDVELLDAIEEVSEDKAELKLTALRLLEPTGENIANSLPIARSGLENALQSYKDGDYRLARTQAISAYLEGIEPVEARLKSIDAKFVVELETRMFNVRQAIEKEESPEFLESEIDKALAIIDDADKLLQSQNLNFWLTFLLALSIVLREALEAFLILAVVIALIRSADAKKALPWVHGGWITAVLCGVAGWYLSDYIIQFGGKNREIMEGLVALFAVAVLVYAGFWLHNKTYVEKWTEFVENKIGVYLSTDRMFGLAAFSFMIVFREAFEVILFLQAIKLEAGPQNNTALGLGTLTAFVSIAIIAWIFLKYTRNIPIRYIFQYSSYFIILLAVILVGKGFHSLQESGWVSVTQLSSVPRVEWLGLYPTLQTVLAQLVLIIGIVVAYFYNKKKYQETVANK